MAELAAADSKRAAVFRHDGVRVVAGPSPIEEAGVFKVCDGVLVAGRDVHLDVVWPPECTIDEADLHPAIFIARQVRRGGRTARVPGCDQDGRRWYE